MELHNKTDTDLRKYHDGAYLYRSPKSHDFDINKFNRFYEQYRIKRDRDMRRYMVDKLDKLDVKANIPMPHQETTGSILIKMKDALFNILDDILQHRYTVNTFTKNNRLFYIGIMVLIIALIVFVYYIFIHKAKKPLSIPSNVIEIRLKKD